MAIVGLDIHCGEGRDSRIGKSQRQRHRGGVGGCYTGDGGSHSDWAPGVVGITDGDFLIGDAV